MMDKASNNNIDKDTKTYLKDLDNNEIKAYIESLGEKPYRAKQVFEWMYKGVTDFSEMTNLSKELRSKLEDNSVLMTLQTLEVNKSSRDDTSKFLFETRDGEAIEAVFMKYKYGNSICMSSQAGCRMGCSFCASGMNGLSRNLTAGEMIDQLLLAQNITGEEIRHIVVMGTGEPFDNYDNVKKMIEILSDSSALGISRRSISVSTCGLVPTIELFAEDLPQVNLAISLHGPNDTIRNKIMPINSRYPIADIIKATKEYIAKTNRRVTFEYALIKGLNDRKQDAEELAILLRGINCHVNLIPLNYVDEANLKPTRREDAEAFMSILEDKNIQVTIRREMGGDINGACGQLRYTR